MKLREVKKYLQDKKLDAIILFNKDRNFRYFVQEDFEHGIMFLTRKDNYLFVSRLYKPRFPGFRAVQWEDFKKDFRAFVKKHRIKRIGYNSQGILLKQKHLLSRHFRVGDVSGFLEGLRQVKTRTEVEHIRKACKTGDKIFKMIVSDFKFKTEQDIVRFIKIEALKAGTEIAFEPIVANAGNAVVAHHNPQGRLRRGFLIMDFGIKYKGYLSDMTRTVFLGKPNKEESALYEKVVSIQEACMQKARVGMKAENLYDYALKLFGRDKKYFVHGLGHGIGVEIHEKPGIGRSRDVLSKGSVFTIEPGYYNPKLKIGIRIEDDVYLGDKKEVLTRSAKELIYLKIR